MTVQKVTGRAVQLARSSFNLEGFSRLQQIASKYLQQRSLMVKSLIGRMHKHPYAACALLFVMGAMGLRVFYNRHLHANFLQLEALVKSPTFPQNKELQMLIALLNTSLSDAYRLKLNQIVNGLIQKYDSVEALQQFTQPLAAGCINEQRKRQIIQLSINQTQQIKFEEAWNRLQEVVEKHTVPTSQEMQDLVLLLEASSQENELEIRNLINSLLLNALTKEEVEMIQETIIKFQNSDRYCIDSPSQTIKKKCEWEMYRCCETEKYRKFYATTESFSNPCEPITIGTIGTIGTIENLPPIPQEVMDAIPKGDDMANIVSKMVALINQQLQKPDYWVRQEQAILKSLDKIEDPTRKEGTYWKMRRAVRSCACSIPNQNKPGTSDPSINLPYTELVLKPILKYLQNNGIIYNFSFGYVDTKEASSGRCDIQV